MNSVLTTKRRRWALAGVGGALLAGGLAIAGGTAFAADDDSTVDKSADLTITAVDAAEAAQDELPDCDVASIIGYDMDATTPVWNVEMTCADGTTQYVEIDGTDGSLISINDDYSVGDDSDDDGTSGDDSGTGPDDGSADVDTDAASSNDK